MNYERHPVEIGPLVFGLVFLGIVVVWALFELEVVRSADAAWIIPVVLIAAGALGVVLAATKPRRSGPAEQPVPSVPVGYQDKVAEQAPENSVGGFGSASGGTSASMETDDIETDRIENADTQEHRRD
ncbi:MAG: hypothetical protein ACRDOY_05585 [Nocardioidaceae bacterium]